MDTRNGYTEWIHGMDTRNGTGGSEVNNRVGSPKECVCTRATDNACRRLHLGGAGPHGSREFCSRLSIDHAPRSRPSTLLPYNFPSVSLPPRQQQPTPENILSTPIPRHHHYSHDSCHRVTAVALKIFVVIKSRPSLSPLHRAGVHLKNRSRRHHQIKTIFLDREWMRCVKKLSPLHGCPSQTQQTPLPPPPQSRPSLATAWCRGRAKTTLCHQNSPLQIYLRPFFCG